MSVLDKVLSLRPGNTVARVGPGSRVPLLNPRELLRALERTPAALPCLPVQARGALPGLLRAARSEDAVLGLACAHPTADRGAAERFVAAVHEAAVEAEHARPVFLQAGPVRVAKADEASLGALREGLYRMVDAGFALVSLDLSRLDSYAAVEALQALAGPVTERELSLEVSAPAPSQGGLLDAYRTLLEGLSQWKVPVCFVRVSEQDLGGAEPDVGTLRSLVDLARDYGAAVSVGDVREGFPRMLPTYVAAGARKVDCVGPFERLALGAWSPDIRAGVEEKAAAAGMPAGELVSVLEDSLPPLAPGARERLEALSFAEATEVFAALGAGGTGHAAMRFLAENRGE
ncbi:hypothetical protein MYSTI_04549 [Myxococcus stipitatus DSM 14675]|uniref:Uncharacterized protein n=1 Tax=Myxococcus stipitatus (strain DSM 14675 / JCM 12634 / Mx s8) TaxID=1278073 RepID=L7UA64_MYXSD|nr:hypothetical protein [Myxococcus stipitatus]AGC45841.1 hypothetical protein MYSTI_04549 [Myxococcus stipitatus DSM 14675]